MHPLACRCRSNVVLALEVLELIILALILLDQIRDDFLYLRQIGRRVRSKHVRKLIALHTPSRLVFRAGTTSLTVRSTRTPPTSLKHFRSGSSARASSNVVNTRLHTVSTMTATRDHVHTCVPLPPVLALRSCSPMLAVHSGSDCIAVESLASRRWYQAGARRR